MNLFILIATSGLIAASALQSCSGGNIGGLSKGKQNNSEADDDPSNDPSDQPTDVSGGFGLTCDPSPNANDSTKTDLTCYFANEEGDKLERRDDAQLRVFITETSQIISVSERTDTLAYEFTFTIDNSDIEQAFIDAKLVTNSKAINPLPPSTSTDRGSKPSDVIKKT